MRANAEMWLDAALRWSPAQQVFHWRASRRLAVLAYHGVDDPERFERHLDHIRRTARPVTLEEALDGFDGRRQLPRRAVLITFDDGHRSVLEEGLPRLRERGLPGVAFVVAGLVDSDRPHWWSEVTTLLECGGRVAGAPPLQARDLVRELKAMSDPSRRAAIGELRRTASCTPKTSQLTRDDLRILEAGGIAIGNHTWSHPCLSRCDDGMCRSEIDRAHRLLSDALGHPPVAFAYPDGDKDARAVAALKELGYRVAFMFDHRLSPRRPTDPLAVSRLRVNSTTTSNRFQTITSGLHPALLRARGRL